MTSSVISQIERTADTEGWGFTEHEPIDVAGVAFRHTLTPPSTAALAEALAELARTKTSVVVVGRGSRLGLGNAPRGATLLLSTAALEGVDVFDAEDGVAHVAAGTCLETVRRHVASDGWELPLDPPGTAATVGGSLASGVAGPRRLGFGAPREAVLGLEVVLAGGQRTRCGGRVVKNVTGYDIAKLYCGSLGTLGVIEGAWLRLQPAPKRRVVNVVSIPETAAEFEVLLEIARRPSTRVAALVGPRRDGLPSVLSSAFSGSIAQPGWRLVLEHAGDEPAVAGDLAHLTSLAARTGESEGADASAVDLIRTAQGSAGPGGVRVHIEVLPTRLGGICTEASEAGFGVLAYPGSGTVYVWAPAEAQREAGPNREGIAWLARLAARADGHATVEALPDALRSGFDVFGGDATMPLRIMRTIKERFDPDGLLGPGRMIAGI